MEILAGVKNPPKVIATIFHADFESAAVGATSIVDQVSGLTLVNTVASPGAVQDDPSMGKCFYFNGTGGFRFSDSRSLPVAGKKIRVKIDFKPEDTTNRLVLYTGSYDNVRIAGWNVCSNSGAGDQVWVDTGGTYVSATLANKNANRRNLEVRMGVGYGTSIRTTELAPVSTTALGQVNGGIFFLGQPDTRSGRISFKGWIKSVTIDQI